MSKYESKHPELTEYGWMVYQDDFNALSEIADRRLGWAKVWKQAAKKWRNNYFWLLKVNKMIGENDDYQIEQLQAENTRLRELLRRLEWCVVDSGESN